MNAARVARIQVVGTLVFALLLTGAMRAAPLIVPQLCQAVVVASSDEKSTMLSEIARSYNAGGHVVAGSCVRVTIEKVNSGDAEHYLETGWRDAPPGLARPDVWSPASRSWIALLRQRAPGLSGTLPDNPISLFQSPLVIGMPAPMAAALGYPQHALGWSDILSLVDDPAGWGSAGHPEWGRFQLAKTNPNISTSGLHALVGTYYAAGGDSPATVQDPTVMGFVGRIEGAVVHYGETAHSFLTVLGDADKRGTALQFVSAFALEEQELVTYDSTARRTPLVAVYPKDGTPMADHPYAVLRWSSGQQAAADFGSYVQSRSAVIDKYYFRDGFGRPGPRLLASLAPSTRPIVQLAPADGAVLQAMLDAWQKLRRRARILVVVDTAAGQVATSASKELAEAMKELQPTDSAGVWEFSSATAGAPIELLPVGPVTAHLPGVLEAIRPEGGRGGLDAAVRAAVTTMAASFDPAAINAVLVVEMAPGPDNVPAQALDTELENQPPQRSVRVFAVGPKSDRLTNLAVAGSGAAYQPGAANHFLRDLISNF